MVAPHCTAVELSIFLVGRVLLIHTFRLPTYRRAGLTGLYRVTDSTREGAICAETQPDADHAGFLCRLGGLPLPPSKIRFASVCMLPPVASMIGIKLMGDDREQ